MSEKKSFWWTKKVFNWSNSSADPQPQSSPSKELTSSNDWINISTNPSNDTISIVSNESQTQDIYSNNKYINLIMKRIRKQLKMDVKDGNDRQYWMPDSNAKECYECGEKFTALRRRHHCRICGQIFCTKCCNQEIESKLIGLNTRESVRSCNYCHKIVIQYINDKNSDTSNTRDSEFTQFRQILMNKTFTESLSLDQNDSSLHSRSGEYTTGSSPLLPQSSMFGVSHSTSFKRKSSIGFREEEYAKPKNRIIEIDKKCVNQMSGTTTSPIHNLSSFNVYKSPIKLNDTSEEELSSLRSDETSHEPLWVKEINEEQEDLQSLDKIGSDLSELSDSVRYRSVSNSDTRLTYSTSTYDIELDFEKDRVSVTKANKSTPNIEDNSLLDKPKDINTTTADELNSVDFQVSTASNCETIKDRTEEKLVFDSINASFNQLYNKLLIQLLEEEGLPLSWVNVIYKLSGKVSALVRPNTHNDMEEMDVRNYIKIKTITNGVKNDCHIINGIVFTKNVSNRKMRQTIVHPKILLLSCPIVYQRNEKKLTFLDTVLLQENEYIKNMIAKICSYEPDLILVEKTVAQIAKDLLLLNDITLICNVKPTIIERISRFTGAEIVSSLDAQIGVPQLGICQKFYLQTFNQKTLMYFDGCPQHMGCTILLRGGTLEELKKIKTICSFMVFCDYNWQLERSFLMDEYCFPSEYTDNKSEQSFSSINFNTKESSPKKRNVSSILVDDKSDPLLSMAFNSSSKEVLSPIEISVSNQNDSTEENFYSMREKMSHFLSKLQLNCSPFLTIPLPYLMTNEGNDSKLRKYFSSRLVWSKRFETDCSEENPYLKVENTVNLNREQLSPTENTSIIKHPFLTRNLKHSANSNDIKSLVADFRSKGSFWMNAKKPSNESNIKSSNSDEFNKGVEQSLQIDVLNPKFHQHLCVLFSSFSYASTNAPNYCVKPWIVNMDFYGCNDIPLGGFLERYCFRSTYSCPSNTCSTPMIEHVRRFVHSNGCVLIILRQLKQNVEAAQSSIITWSWCQKCKTGTPYSNLSPDSWSLSFAKYLELKFYGDYYRRRATSSSVACLEHSLHKDHFQFFAYKQIVASFKYLPITLHEIALPLNTIVLNEDNISGDKMDSEIVVRDDDPGSIIAFALNSSDYEKQMTELLRQSSSPNIKRKFTSSTDTDSISDPSVNKSSTNSVIKNIDLQYSDSTTKFYCCVYFAEQFRKFRTNIFDSPNGEQLYVRSLQNCVPWKARGGKSGSTFCKTVNDRFILKEMSKLEFQSFLNIANYYFDYCTRAIHESRPSLLAKIFGVYRTSYKNMSTNKASKLYLLVMENLFYNCNIIQKFDLKGSMRNRLVNTNSSDLKADQIVLLDENLLQMTCDSPLYIHSHSKAILIAAIDNDSLFLSSHSVMDYSLLVGINDETNEFVVGIIDYIRPFTWDKKIESVVKSVGSQGKLPTIVQPDLYRIRFCEAMEQYFLCVPDKWYSILNFN